jgi:hypothetical protein
LNEEKLLKVTKTAIIILELENIKSKYFSIDWKEKSKVLEELAKFINHSSNRLAYDIFDFLSLVASQTRGGMTEELASSVFGHIQSFCPSFHEKKDRKQAIELAKQCIHIGNNIAYDSFIHLRKITIARYGLTIMKFIYRKAKENNIPLLIKEVEEAYTGLKTTLHRHERSDLGDALEIVKIFHDDLEEWDLGFPALSEHLTKRIKDESKLSSR